jgi:DNA integrity scanning protein DisA with diadenylate cyclase activity
MQEFIEVCVSMKDVTGATVLLAMTDERKVVNSLLRAIKDVPVVIITEKTALHKSLARRGVAVIRTRYSGAVLADVKSKIIEAYAEGFVKPADKVLCVLANDINALITFDVKKTELAELEKVRGVKREVIEKTLFLSLQLIREGREGRCVGTLFVIGDVDNVLRNSRQLIINPFKGHPREARNILDDENWETIKELAQLDGGFVVDSDGCIEAGGRYFNVDWSLQVPAGWGGRHMAALSVTKNTKAVAVVVSESGTLSVFRRGKLVLKV